MRYLLLICTDEAADAAATEEEGNASTAAYMSWMGEMGDRLLGGERLRPSTDATTVAVKDGKVLTTDGPFAETKEQIGGYFVVEAADLDQAIEAAAKLPGAAVGSIEVRPIWEM